MKFRHLRLANVLALAMIGLTYSGCMAEKIAFQPVESPHTQVTDHSPMAMAELSAEEMRARSTKNTQPCNGKNTSGNWKMRLLSSNLPEDKAGRFFQPFQVIRFSPEGEINIASSNQSMNNQSILFTLEIGEAVDNPYTFGLNPDGYFEIANAQDNALLLPGSCRIVTHAFETSGANQEPVALKKGDMVLRTAKIKPEGTKMLLRVFEQADLSQLEKVGDKPEVTGETETPELGNTKKSKTNSDSQD